MARTNPKMRMILPTSFARTTTHPMDATLYFATRNTIAIDYFVVGIFVTRRPTVILPTMTNTELVMHIES